MENKMEKIPSREKIIQPETVKNLERMIELPIKSKIEILAVVFDIKPTSSIQTDLIYSKQLPILRERIGKLFADFNLLYKEYGIDYQNEPFVSLFYVIAKNSNSLKRFEEIYDPTQNINEYHKSFGKALGIPDSAIDGFINKQMLSSDEINTKFSKEERAFLFFTPSKIGWESEKEYVRNFAEKVKQIAPNLYNEAVASTKN